MDRTPSAATSEKNCRSPSPRGNFFLRRSGGVTELLEIGTIAAPVTGAAGRTDHSGEARGTGGTGARGTTMRISRTSFTASWPGVISLVGWLALAGCERAQGLAPVLAPPGASPQAAWTPPSL